MDPKSPGPNSSHGLSEWPIRNRCPDVAFNAPSHEPCSFK